MEGILTFILAGGRGERLDPLTRDRTKPAVPFGGIYRIIDFTLSNCVNSGLRRMYVLTQYKSFSLQKHLMEGWNVVSSQLGEFIDVIPAQQRISANWYRGTADAIYQNIYAILDNAPDLVLILAGDHVYKMNYRHMIEYHRQRQSDMTVACVTCSKNDALQFGVIEVDGENHVRGFQEKPDNPKVIPGRPDEIFASMGIYLFNRDVLLSELEKDAKKNSEHDFGLNVIPQMLADQRKLYVYNFVDENEHPKYWRDIGTRDAYYQANMDLLNDESSFNLYDHSWPVRTFHAQYPPIRIKDGSTGTGIVKNSLIAGGCVVTGASIEHSVLSPNVVIEEGAEIKNSIIMEGVRVGQNSKIRNAIIDKEVEVPVQSKIGFNNELDCKRFALTTSGIVIVAKKSAVEE